MGVSSDQVYYNKFQLFLLYKGHIKTALKKFLEYFRIKQFILNTKGNKQNPLGYNILCLKTHYIHFKTQLW